MNKEQDANGDRQGPHIEPTTDNHDGRRSLARFLAGIERPLVQQAIDGEDIATVIYRHDGPTEVIGLK